MTVPLDAEADDVPGRSEDDILVMRDRMLAPYLTSPDPEPVRELRLQLDANGSWPDVNYAGNSTVAWEPAEHLRRLLTLTQAWFAPASPTHDSADLAGEISRALDCWLQKDPRRPWWWDRIGAPRMLSIILLMFEEHLTGFQKRKGSAILARARFDETGQNMVWQAEIIARRAVLQRDAGLLLRAFREIAAAIQICEEEGIQADYSFHQHGPCLYNHGYGARFAEDAARLAAMLSGTPYAYPAETIALLSSYILDGSQWLARGPHADFGAQGRFLTRPGQTAAYLAQPARDMLNVPTGREDDFAALAARIAGEPAAPLIGNKHFYRSDIMVHHRPGCYMSARMYSTRTLNTDQLSGCDQGLLSHYLAEGATCMMRHGNEYADLFPVWDWRRIPGTTVELAPQSPGEPSRRGTTAFAGGASDGTAGVAAFHLQRDALRARKAWFFFSNLTVCLGTDICCDTEHTVITTLNQCRLRGAVILGRDKGTEVLEPGSRTVEARWTWHDGIGYLFERTVPVDLANVSCTGSWQRISAQASSDVVTDQVFLLGLTHGVRPNAAAYAYAVVPGIEAEDVPQFVREPPFEIAMNAADIQGVYHPGDAALGLVFHEAGQFEWQQWRVTADRPCALVVRQERGVWHIAAADPAAGSGTLCVDVSWPNGYKSKINLALPEGRDVGASVVASMDAGPE